MKGFIKQAAAVGCFSAALFAVLGCQHYREVVDPCWPARYNGMARQSIRDMNGAQEDQGHKLDQTLWNHHFEAGTDILNAAGKDQLRYISRRQPHPDFQIWLQFPHDVAKDRDGLIAKRKESIRVFLTTQTMSNNGIAYQIGVHDHAVPTYPSEWTNAAYKKVGDDISKGVSITSQAPSGSSGARP
ncbi:MAG: hypothetical protein HY289_00295 [Planctomycetes bacterium]|nr:hypothetical protein [Planctomycetota bacterium]